MAKKTIENRTVNATVAKNGGADMAKNTVKNVEVTVDLNGMFTKDQWEGEGTIVNALEFDDRTEGVTKVIFKGMHPAFDDETGAVKGMFVKWADPSNPGLPTADMWFKVVTWKADPKKNREAGSAFFDFKGLTEQLGLSGYAVNVHTVNALKDKVIKVGVEKNGAFFNKTLQPKNIRAIEAKMNPDELV